MISIQSTVLGLNKRFRYNEEKNVELLKNRAIGFEEIILQIQSGNLLDMIEHHHQDFYILIKKL